MTISDIYRKIIGLLGGLLFSLTVSAFQSTLTPYSWINTAGHTAVNWSTSNCSYWSNSASGDDTLSTQLNMGFQFNFQGTNYSSVYIMSNGRLQFGNTWCGSGTQTTSPRTYPLPLPSTRLNHTIKVYDADLIPSGGGTVTYAQTGSTPDRQFVITWSSVPEWGASGSFFNLQAIIKENGEFILQYGASNNASGGKAEIGWQNTTSDYGLYSFTNIGSLANQAILFYPPLPAITSVGGACGSDDFLVVSYAAPVTSQGLSKSNYALTGTTINSVTLQDASTVILQTAGLTPGQAYSLSVLGGTAVNADFSGFVGRYYDQRASGNKVSQPVGLFGGGLYYRLDSTVDFNWNYDRPTVFPALSGNEDRFSNRWTGYI